MNIINGATFSYGTERSAWTNLTGSPPTLHINVVQTSDRVVRMTIETRPYQPLDGASLLVTLFEEFPDWVLRSTVVIDVGESQQQGLFYRNEVGQYIIAFGVPGKGGSGGSVQMDSVLFAGNDLLISPEFVVNGNGNMWRVVRTGNSITMSAKIFFTYNGATPYVGNIQIATPSVGDEWKPKFFFSNAAARTPCYITWGAGGVDSSSEAGALTITWSSEARYGIQVHNIWLDANKTRIQPGNNVWLDFCAVLEADS